MTDPARASLQELARSLEGNARNVLEIVEQIRAVDPGQGPALEASAGAVYQARGIDQINDLVRRTSQNARTEILTAQPGGPRPEATLAAALAAVRPQLGAGVSMRTLYQHTARFDEATKAYVRAATALGAEVRTLDEFFERLIVVDRATAFIPATSDRTEALVITHPGIVRFMVTLFERHWDRAEEFGPADMSNGAAAELVTPTIRDAIRRLLVSGHPDKVIARRLGISQRSLQEHVSRLKASVGAKSRIQLGYLLGRAEAGYSGHTDEWASSEETVSFR